jgi:UPF0716 family protein affecting phage T7 exclusion
MKVLLIFIPSIRKFIKRKPKKPETVTKRFLSREKDKIDKKIDSALILGDYSSAMVLTGKMNRVERKLNRVERKKKPNEKN